MTATISQPAAAATPAAPHLREDLLTPRFYTTEIDKAARTDLEQQRPAFEAMLAEMEADHNREHFDRKAPLDRLRALSPEAKTAYESYLVRSCVSEFSGFLLFKGLSRRLFQAERQELGRYLSALLSARGACIEHLAAAYCFLLFMGHELMNGAASQSPLGGGCVGT